MQNLGTLGGTSFGTGINDSGQVSGSSRISPGGAYHAFLYSGGVMQDLGTLGGEESRGQGINAGGDVAGYSNTSDGLTHAFLYSGGVMQDLGSLGTLSSFGWDVNAGGQVVGYLGTVVTQPTVAFLYDGGTMYEIDDLIDVNDPLFGLISFYSAYGINDAGQIAATGCGRGGCYAYRLGPIATTPFRRQVHWPCWYLAFLV